MKNKMSNITADVLDNIFYQARCRAATHNEQLKSREGAADIMLIDRGRLYRIEKGVTNPYPEEVHLMADLYHAPELQNYYCRNCCPLGKAFPEMKDEAIETLGIQIFLASDKICNMTKTLLEIVEDGRVDKNEQIEFMKMVALLNELNKITQSVNLWIEKNRIENPEEIRK